MLNRVQLIGNLGQDVSMRYSQSGTAIANFSLATAETWKDQSGVKQTKTEWHRVTAFKRLAEICGEYLNKGSKVYIEGKIQTRKWTDKDGNDRWSTEIVANSMLMLDSKGDRQEKPSEPPVPEPAEEMGEDVPF